jgi:hypothetical protein
MKIISMLFFVLLGLTGSKIHVFDYQILNQPAEVKSEPENGIMYKHYFPLVVGNSWSYVCTIRPGCNPLFSMIAEVERAQASSKLKQGDWIRDNGKCINAKSGIETYTINNYDITLDAFVVSVSKGAIDKRKYELQGIKDIYWRYNDFGVWEVVRTQYFNDIILVNGYIAYLKPGEGEKSMTDNKREVICEFSNDQILVPAGRFTGCLRNVTTQLGGTDMKQIRTIQFFAKNIGLVKETQYDLSGRETYTLELKEFHVK